MVKFKTRNWSRVLRPEPRGKIGFLVFSREFPSFYPHFFESSAGFLEAPYSELMTRGTSPLLGLGIFGCFGGHGARVARVLNTQTHGIPMRGNSTPILCWAGTKGLWLRFHPQGPYQEERVPDHGIRTKTDGHRSGCYYRGKRGQRCS